MYWDDEFVISAIVTVVAICAIGLALFYFYDGPVAETATLIVQPVEMVSAESLDFATAE